MIVLKNYQKTAIDELLEDSKKLLKRSGSGKLTFKSPTGSGKTLVMAEFLKRLVDDFDVTTPLTFIWTAPRKLHEQSKESIETYYKDIRALECSFFEDLDDRQIQEKEILFFNWESINKKDNIYIKENERENNLSAIIERTKDAGREIILVIDECHHHATSEISQKLINDINPKLAIEVSATPVVANPDEIVSVPLEDVKLEGMIKKSVLLNPGFENLIKGKKITSKLAGGTDLLVLDQALKKRKELVKAYKKEGLDINPLVLVQLPDRKTSLEEKIKQDVIKNLKDKYKVTVENGKLAIYLSENKENLENISKQTNEAEVLIFKQAIALGWDCPRAHILVLLRDWKSLVFSIQTIGRIMRMPEPAKGHYANEELNHGYVYTNLKDIEIREDIARDYVTVYTSHRRKDYSSLNLMSVYRERHREKTRLSPLFIEIFLKEADKYKLDKKIKVTNQQVKISLISDLEAESIDKLPQQKLKSQIKLDYTNLEDLQKLFDFFVLNNLSPFYPEDRSVGRIKETIYRFFYKKMKLDYQKSFEKIINIVLSEENVTHFTNVIDASKEAYLNEILKRDGTIKKTRSWEIPEILSFGGNYNLLDSKLSAMQPFYYDNRWKPEEAFINFLEKQHKAINWWFKNGDRDSIFFAVEYEEAGEVKPFYPDFIVSLKNGSLGVFDTKSGRTIKDAREKSDGLQKYFKEQSAKRKKLFGGIVANTNSKDFSGRWIVYKGKSKNLNPENFSNWEILGFESG